MGASALAAWRVPLRLARREIRLNLRRNLLAVLLVALPVATVVAAATVGYTRNVSLVESLPQRLGTAQARVTFDPAAGPLEQQLADPLSAYPATDRPGFRRGADGTVTGPPGWQPVTDARRLQQLTGGRVLPTTSGQLQVVLGSRRPTLTLLGVDGRDRAYTGMAGLTSGRWPRTPGEVLVTDRGRRSGMPASGTVRLAGTPGSRAGAVTVVGTAQAPQVHLVGLPRAGSDDSTQETAYLLDRPAPVTWADIRRLNDGGAAVLSRLAVESPEPAPVDQGSADSTRALVALLGLGIVATTALLAAPALASSGERQRHELAQLSSNGARRALLRRTVGLRALLIGLVAAGAAVPAGLAVAALAIRVWQHLRPDDELGPFQVERPIVLGVAAVAVVAALLAALVPAVQAGRVDVIAVLRGRVSPRRVRAGWPLAGLVVAVAAGALLLRQLTTPGRPIREVPVAASGAVLFVGALMTLPWILWQLSRLAGRLPVAARLGVRDVGRQRARSTASVAVALGAVATMTMLVVAGGSDDAQARRDHPAIALPGHGRLSADTPAHLAEAEREVRSVIPGAVLRPLLRTGSQIDPTAPLGGADDSVVATPTGCTPQESYSLASEGMRCGSVVGGQTAGILVLPVDLAREHLVLDAAQERRLEAGAVLVVRHAGDTAPVPAELTLQWGSFVVNRDGEVSSFTPRGRATLPAIVVHPRPGTPAVDGGWKAVVTPATAARHGWPTSTEAIDVTGPGGRAMSPQQESTVVETVAARTADLSVERGPDETTVQILRGLMAAVALLVLLSTLIGTALTQSESRGDQATLAAVGAEPGARRRVAAAQAATMALVGSVVGLAVGLVPGVGLAVPLTVGGWTPGGHADPVIVIPWVPLLAVVLGVPLLAALAAAAVTRTRPVLVRRPG